MKNKWKIITAIITYLILIIMCSTTTFAALTELQEKATDLNHDGKRDIKDLDLIVSQPFPERVKDGVEPEDEDVYYIFRDNGIMVDADDYVVDITKSEKSIVITDEAKIEKAIKSVYTGQQQNNLLGVLHNGTYMKLQSEYNVNAIFAIAVCTIESGCGTAWDAIPSGTYNWFSIIGNYNGRSVTTNREWRSYPSFDESTLDFGDLIANSIFYFQAEKFSVKEIAPTYCNADWGVAVVEQMNKIYSAMGISSANRRGFSASGDILKAADQVHRDEMTWTYSTGGDLRWNDIEASLNNPNKVTCCATFVSCALYVAGCFSAEEFNRECGYNSAQGLYDFLEKKGWTRINSYSELQAGDVVWLYRIDAHVQLYAGDGTWYNAGTTGAIQRPSPYSDNASGDFVCAMRKN